MVHLEGHVHLFTPHYYLLTNGVHLTVSCSASYFHLLRYQVPSSRKRGTHQLLPQCIYSCFPKSSHPNTSGHLPFLIFSTFHTLGIRALFLSYCLLYYYYYAMGNLSHLCLWRSSFVMGSGIHFISFSTNQTPHVSTIPPKSGNKKLHKSHSSVVNQINQTKENKPTKPSFSPSPSSSPR